MGGIVGGGGGKTQTVQQTNQPPEYLRPFVTDAAQQAANLYNTNKTQFFPGQTYVDLDPATQQALGLTQQRALAGSPVVGEAQDLAQATLRGDFLNANPYADAQFDQIGSAIRRNLNSGAAAGGAGYADSGAFANAQADAIGRAATNFYGQNYANERQLQQGAIGMAPGLAQQDYTDLAALSSVGARNEAQQQAMLQDAMSRHYAQYDLPRQDLANYVQALQGTAYGGTSTSQQPYQGPNMGTQLLGAGLSALPFLFSLSDRRAKTDIKKVGKLDNDLPVYSYRYKGDPRPMIGVMAQDVAKVKPDAVAKLPGGLLAVDYSKAVA
jgi:hypothetical protein